MLESNHRCLYDNFPLEIVTIRLIILVGISVTGAVLMYNLHLWAMIGYLALYVISIYAILALVCKNCYYHGKRCDLSLGLVSGLFFKKGHEGETFIRNAPKTIPFLILMVLPPPITGIVLFVQQLSTIILLLLIANIVSIITLIVTTRTLSCPNCKMQAICPFCMVPVSDRIND